MDRKNGSPNKVPGFSGLIFYLILIVLICVVFVSVFGKSASKEKQEYIYSYIESDKYDVSEVVVSGTQALVKYEKDGKELSVSIDIPYESVDDVIEHLEQAKQDGKIKNYIYEEPFDWNLISNIFLIIAVCGSVVLIFVLLTRQSGDKGVFNFGQNKAKLATPNQIKVKFADVAGCAEEKEELQEMVDFLKNPDKYKKLGAKIPKGVILSGSPGTGKTLLAKAVAGEAGVPFFHMSGSDFVEMFVGVGASRVRSLFTDAKKAAPSVIFIDEIDAVGRRRGSGLGGGHDEREQTLNQILVEMDGFDTNTNVIVMAATNRSDVLDPALLRPGRFDRKVIVTEPDLHEREAILKIHAKGKPLNKDIDLKDVARATVGFTGADLANLLNEAALLAARRDKKEITPLEVSDATYRVMMGPEKKSKKPSEKARKLTAYHEAGHAVVLRATSTTEKVDRVTIIPAGRAGGFTSYKPIEDTAFQTKSMLLDTIRMSLGGRAAEEIFLDDISIGASSDLQHCNHIATSMIKRFGLSDKFKNMVFGDDSNEVFIGGSYGQVQPYSDATAAEIDKEVQHIIDSCYADALRILNEKRAVVEGLAQRLLEVNKVDGPEFEEIYNSNGDLTAIKAREAEMQAKYGSSDTAATTETSVAPAPAVEAVPDVKSVDEIKMPEITGFGDSTTPDSSADQSESSEGDKQ